jgi:hypothetical protein
MRRFARSGAVFTETRLMGWDEADIVDGGGGWCEWCENGVRMV